MYGFSHRLALGGKETLDSYGLTLVDFLSHPHLEFLENLKWFIELSPVLVIKGNLSSFRFIFKLSPLF